MKISAMLALLAALAALPATAHAWADKAYAYRKSITLDAKAAGLSDGVKGFPALVRLDSSQFTFTDAKADGSDIRFYDSDDHTALPFQVERFDPSLGLAMIWVRVPEVPAGGSHQVWMYYGDPKAGAAPAQAPVFDPSYHAVYHFSAPNPAADASAYRNTASSVTAAPAAAIGAGAAFDGRSGVTLPGSPSLAVNPSDGFTLEAWVRQEAGAPGAANTAAAAPAAGQASAAAPLAIVYARRQGAASLVVGLDHGTPFVAVNGQRAAGTSPLGSDWSQLAVTGDASRTLLYVNGVAVATVNAGVPAMNGPATLGTDPQAAGGGFSGEMDEVRLSAAARPAGWIAADYAVQRSGAPMVAYGADEKPSGSGFGYFGIIFKNITPDAWVVIAILMVMAVLSWIVMWAKGTYIGSVARENRAFDQRFRKLDRADILALEKNAERGLQGSSLYRLYQTGVGELHARGDLKGQALTEETVEAIRASLDAQQVEENQKLDRFMVLLTIAISGGPFIGLLGTVLGVMITFAAIAAAGDVNVNAIAPGIAAALLATVAGLFVAIPALFGYNYLASRNADISARMQVFSDQFITRLAEVQRNAALRAGASRMPAE